MSLMMLVTETSMSEASASRVMAQNSHQSELQQAEFSCARLQNVWLVTLVQEAELIQTTYVRGIAFGHLVFGWCDQ